MIVRKIGILLTSTMLTFTLFTSVAAADAEGVQKYREAVMKAVGGHMGAMANSLKGQVFTDNLAIHSAAMSNLADIAPSIFPAGSGGGKSEALPAIWENPDEFKLRMDDFVKAAKAMNEAVAGGEMGSIGAGLQNLGKSCKGCHDDFRKDD
jgi:cytochrome c556